MSRMKSFYGKHYYFVSFLTFILLYNFIIIYVGGSWKFHDEAYIFHLVDYSMGFCSRFLLGAVYNFIFDNNSVQTVILFNVLLFITFLVIVSFFLEKLMLKIEDKNREIVLFFLMFLLTGTSTFSMCVYMLGSFDLWWIYLSVIFIIFLSCKSLYIFIVPIFIVIIFVHYASVVAFIPFFVLLLIYKISIVHNKKEKIFLWFITIVSGMSAVLFTAYFVIFDHTNLTYSMEEFVSIIKSRGSTSDPIYFLTSLYDYDYYGMMDTEYFKSIESPVLYALAFLGYRIKVNFALIPIEQGVIPFLLNLPIVVLIFLYFKNKIKEEPLNKVKKFSCFCMCSMYFCTIILSLFLSTDIVRFLSHSYMVLFASFLYVVYTEKNENLECVKKYLTKIPRGIIVIYILFYAIMIFKPYT